MTSRCGESTGVRHDSTRSYFTSLRRSMAALHAAAAERYEDDKITYYD